MCACACPTHTHITYMCIHCKNVSLVKILGFFGKYKISYCIILCDNRFISSTQRNVCTMSVYAHKCLYLQPYAHAPVLYTHRIMKYTHITIMCIQQVIADMCHVSAILNMFDAVWLTPHLARLPHLWAGCEQGPATPKKSTGQALLGSLLENIIITIIIIINIIII